MAGTAIRAKAVSKATAAGKKRSQLRTPLNMRIQHDLRDLIDRAAKATGKNRTDFVLDAARHAAQNALLDQTRIVLEPKAFAEFTKMLDAPPNPSAKLRKALLTPAPWE